MKRVATIFAWALLPTMISYLGVSFTYLTVNPFNWTQEARAIVAIIGLSLGPLTSILAYNE